MRAAGLRGVGSQKRGRRIRGAIVDAMRPGGAGAQSAFGVVARRPKRRSAMRV
jgi:hypothetical protein